MTIVSLVLGEGAWLPDGATEGERDAKRQGGCGHLCDRLWAELIAIETSLVHSYLARMSTGDLPALLTS